MIVNLNNGNIRVADSALYPTPDLKDIGSGSIK